jgi:hypothetical protein
VHLIYFMKMMTQFVGEQAFLFHLIVLDRPAWKFVSEEVGVNLENELRNPHTLNTLISDEEAADVEHGVFYKVFRDNDYNVGMTVAEALYVRSRAINFCL